MLKIINLQQIPISDRVYFYKKKIFTYNDGIFSQFSPETNELEEFDFARNLYTDIHLFRNNVLAYVVSNVLRIEQLKKGTTLIDVACMKKNKVVSIGLSPSSIHTIIGNDDGTINVYHNISASSILKFPLFPNDTQADYVDFLEENIIMGATKKNIILVDILEKSVVAKIAAKGIITSIITSKDKIVYATREKDIYLVDIEDLSNISTIKIATVEKNILDISFNIYNNAIYILSSNELFHVVFGSPINKIEVELIEAVSISIVSSSSLVVGMRSSSLLIEGLELKDTPIENHTLKNKTPIDDNIIRFLSVDDSATIRLVIKRAILNNFEDVEVYEANDGLEAMALLKKIPNINVMLLDWNMPNMNGEEVVEAVSKMPELAKMKIIMATTEGAKDKVKEMLSKGVKGYLVKPFTPKSVIPMMTKLIELIKSER